MNHAATPELSGPILMLGATSAVGSHLCMRFHDDGARPIAVGRNREKLAELADHGIETHAVDLSDRNAADYLAQHLRATHPIAAVATLGGWYVEEETEDLPQERWDQTIQANLTTHFVAAAAFAPILTTAAATYLAVNGIASHEPCAGSVAISVTGAGQAMMLDVLAIESLGQRVRVAELVIDTPVLMPGETHDKDEAAHTIDEVYAAARTLLLDTAPRGRTDRRVLPNQ